MKKHLIVILLFVLAHPVIAQNYYRDWRNIKLQPSSRAEALNEFIWESILFSDSDSAYKLAIELQEFSQSHGYKKGVASSYNVQGLTFYIVGDYGKALEYHQKSLKIRNEIKDSIGTASSLNNIGLIYFKQKNYKDALDYYKRSLTFERAMGNTGGIAASLNNIGLVYMQTLDLEKGREQFQSSLLLNRKISYMKGVATSYNNLGQISILSNDYDAALQELNGSYVIYDSLSDKLGIATVSVNLGRAYRGKNEYKMALKYCRRAYDLALEIGSLSGQKDGCECLYQIYKEKNQPLEALSYLEIFNFLEDSLKVGETTKILERMEFSKRIIADSVTREKDNLQVELNHKLELSRENNIRNYLIGFGLLILIIAIAVYSRLRLVRASKKVVEKERKRSDDLLLNILPAEIAEELKDKGEAEARAYDNASILFTDFKGFTELSASLTAKDLVSEINQYFKAFDAICLKYNIEKIKTIGDAYMAVGGIPVSNPESIKNTVLAALEMADFVEEKYQNKGGAFQMRAGIHTGHVVAGIAGVNKFQYDIWGDSVNLASRMESSGVVGKVNISQDTYDLLKDDKDFQFEPRGKIKAKGKGEVEMYFVLRGIIL